MNWGITVLQTVALPLGYGTVFYKGRLKEYFFKRPCFFGADYGARTRYLHLGKVALYQMS